jgi:hypothetical protein
MTPTFAKPLFNLPITFENSWLATPVPEDSNGLALPYNILKDLGAATAVANDQRCPKRLERIAKPGE